MGTGVIRKDGQRAAKNHLDRILDATIAWADLRPSGFLQAPCVLCGVFDYDALATFVLNQVEFFLVRCRRCRLMWRNPIPNAEFLRDLYSNDYFDVAKSAAQLVNQVGIADSTREHQEWRRRKTREEVARWIQRGLSPSTSEGKPARFLEIGGGRGYLQSEATARGWNTVGIEISQHGIVAALERGLFVMPIVLEDFYEKYAPVGCFDVVVLFDFLEHVVDPAKVLRLVRSLLLPDGVAILRVPTIAHDACPSYHLIDHIWHFTRDAMHRLILREGFFIEPKGELSSGRFPENGGKGSVTNVSYFLRRTRESYTGGLKR